MRYRREDYTREYCPTPVDLLCQKILDGYSQRRNRTAAVMHRGSGPCAPLGFPGDAPTTYKRDFYPSFLFWIQWFRNGQQDQHSIAYLQADLSPVQALIRARAMIAEWNGPLLTTCTTCYPTNASGQAGKGNR